MNPEEQTLLSLLTGGRYSQSSDLPTGKEVATSAIDKIIESDKQRRSQVIMPAGEGMFGRQTAEFTQGDLEDILQGFLGGGGVAGTIKAGSATKGASSLKDLAKGIFEKARLSKNPSKQTPVRTYEEEITRLLTPEQINQMRQSAYMTKDFSLKNKAEATAPLRAAAELYGKRLPSGERVVRMVDPERTPQYGLPMSTLPQLVSLILSKYSK
jgi:hypothetical protein